MVDNDLSPKLAEALRLFGYNITSVRDEFPVQPGDEGVKDPAIIDWLAQRRAVWVTADDKAKGQHRRQLEASGVHVVWVKRPKEGMSAFRELQLLVQIIDDVVNEVQNAHGPIHFEAKFVSGKAKRATLMRTWRGAWASN